MNHTELSRLVDQYMTEAELEARVPTLSGLIEWHRAYEQERDVNWKVAAQTPPKDRDRILTMIGTLKGISERSDGIADLGIMALEWIVGEHNDGDLEEWIATAEDPETER